MANIYSRGKQLWLTYNIYGKQYREPLGLKDSKENRILAKRIKLKKEADIINGLYPEIRQVKKKTLQESFDQFIKTKEKRSESTIALYKYAHKKFSDFAGEIEIRKVNDELVEEFEKNISYIKTKKGKLKRASKNSIEIIFRHLRIIFEYYKNKNFIDRNPFPRKEKIDKKINVISPEEMDFILRQLERSNKDQYRAINLLYMTGLRASELTRLVFEDIDFKKNLIYINNSKGRRTDKFPLYKVLRDFILNNWSEEERKGKVVPYKTKDSLKFFGRFLQTSKMNHYSIHEIRKTFISRLANAGMSVFDLQRIARHKDIRTTQKSYIELEYDRIGNKISDVIYSTISITPPLKSVKVA